MARAAQAWVRTRFFRMPRPKARPVQTLQADLVERHLPGQRGHRRNAMARGARSLAMAGRAEVALTPGPHSVLAEPVAIVNEVARWRRVLGGKVDVTGIAAAQVPLILVLVTAEADRHLREKRLRPRLGDRAVAPNAVSVDHRIVFAVVEAHVLAGEVGLFAHGHLAVASAAGAFVMRPGMATAALGVGGKMQRFGLARVLHPRVALDAIDPLVHMSAVLERMRFLGWSETEHARACGECQRKGHRDGEPEPHRISSARETRASAFTS
jgi:hypothetical protein